MLIPNVTLFAEYNNSKGDHAYSLQVVGLHVLPGSVYNAMVVFGGEIVLAKSLPNYAGLQYFKRPENKAKQKDDTEARAAKQKQLDSKEST